MGMVWFKRLLNKFPLIALSFGIRKFILATFGSLKIVKQMCQFFVNIPVHRDDMPMLKHSISWTFSGPFTAAISELLDSSC